MPSRNTVREYDAPAYYHIYNRGAGVVQIFKDAQDKYKFISLLERYLSDDDDHADYPTYDLDLLAYCVMSNHFHLLVYHTNDPKAITQLMKSVSTAYSMYYNLKYKSHGHVFQSVFKASRIHDESYLLHITRYIHLNPDTYMTYKWSSLPYYLGKTLPEWLKPELFEKTHSEYRKSLKDYTDKRKLLKEIQSELAL